MAINPQELLIKLEAEKEANGTDPNALLDQLESEVKNNPVIIDGGVASNDSGGSPEKSFMESLSIDMLPHAVQGVAKAAQIIASPAEEIEATKKTIVGSAISGAKGFVQSGQGLKQITLEAAEKMGIVEEGTAEAYTSKTTEERKLFAKEFNREFGDQIEFDISAGVGSAIPSLLVFRKLPVGETVKGTMAIGGGVGGVTGLTSFIPKDSEESRLFNTLQGTGVGIALSGLFNIFPAVRNKVREMLGKAARTKEATKALELSTRTKTDFKLSQVTDDPIALQLEKISQATLEGERQANKLASKQIQQNLSFWKRTAAKFSGSKKDFGTHLEKVFKKTLGDSSSGTGLVGARAKQAKIDYAAVSKASGGQKNIPIFNFMESVKSTLSKNRTSSSEEKVKLAKKLLKIAKRFKSGKINGEQMQDLLETFGAASKGTGRIFSDIDSSIERSMAKKMFSSIQKDLKSAANSKIAGAAELKIARDNYAKNSEAIKALEKSALGTLFGPKTVKTAESIEKTFASMNSGQIKGVMGVLSKTDPTLQGRLQRFWIENQIKKSAITKGFDQNIFSPEGMLKLKSGLSRDTFKAVFNTAASRRQVMDGIRSVQRIIVSNSKAASSFGAFIKNAAGVAASMDRTFIARLGAEVLTPKAIAGYVSSKEGVTLLRTLAKTNNVNAGAAILIKLNELRKEEDQNGD